MAELLLELFSEEIPARMQDRAREDLARSVADALAAADLAFDQPVRSFATPRRLTVVVTGLPLQQADRVVERKGPRADAPEQARAGFLRGLTGADYTLEEREDKKAKVVFALVRERGRAVRELLTELLPAAIGRLPWPKSMRAGDSDFRWVRPLQSILCVLDGAVVRFEVGCVASSDHTRGHRFMAPEPFAVRDFADYMAKLRAAKVILDGAERRAIIARGAEELASSHGLVVADDPALLDEVKGLVEWPTPLLAGIDESFMSLPPEVLVTTMRTNQKFFALCTRDGGLARRFVLVANMQAGDGGAAIVAGNERVLRARLWDAKFFWEQDRKRSLESRLPALGRMVFHADLGTIFERVQRLEELAVYLAFMDTPGEEGGSVAEKQSDNDRLARLTKRAAHLAKADLATYLVVEFPDLQGIAGSHLARVQSEPEAVCYAIAEQYAPRGDGPIPSSLVSIAVALADKLDLIVGLFGIGLRPTGSKDPFGLRRAAVGIIRLILHNRMSVRMRRAIRFSYTGYHTYLSGVDYNILEEKVHEFIVQRLKIYLHAEGVRHDVVSAILQSGRDDDLVDIVNRAKALQNFIATDEGANLLVGWRRASNISSIEEKKDKLQYRERPDRGLFEQNQEASLLEELDRAMQLASDDMKRGNYTLAMKRLSLLRRPIDDFFQSVLVNSASTEVRANRLRLLNLVRQAPNPVGDFSLIESARDAST